MKENKSLDMLTPLLQLYPCSLQLQSCDITAVPALAWSQHGAVPPAAGSAQAGDRPISCAVWRHEVTAAELLPFQCASRVLTSG